MFRTSVGRDLKGPRRGRNTAFSFSKEFFAGLAAGLTVAVGVFLWSRQTIEATPVTAKAPRAVDHPSPADDPIEAAIERHKRSQGTQPYSGDDPASGDEGRGDPGGG
jgi:hypothetical protein